MGCSSSFLLFLAVSLEIPPCPAEKMLCSTPRAAAMHRCYTPHTMLSAHAGLRLHVGMTVTRHQLSLSQYGVPHTVRALTSGGSKCSDSSLRASSGHATPSATPPSHNRCEINSVSTVGVGHGFFGGLDSLGQAYISMICLHHSSDAHGVDLSHLGVGSDSVMSTPATASAQRC